MPRFFTGPVAGPRHTLTGPDAAHIAKSLRMRPGEALTLCDGQGMDYNCILRAVSPELVEAEVVEQRVNRSEPSIHAVLYQGVPKSDKMDWIVQKAVELGVCEIVPVLTGRCVSRPDPKSMAKKVDRWQKIAEEAAKQSGRGRIPAVLPAMEFRGAVARSREAADRLLFLYEGGGAPMQAHISPEAARYSLFVGPEGGFAPEEADYIREMGGGVVTLGPRILRTETAPLAALSALMFASGNMN